MLNLGTVEFHDDLDDRDEMDGCDAVLCLYQLHRLSMLWKHQTGDSDSHNHLLKMAAFPI